MCMQHVVCERVNSAFKALSGVRPFTHEVDEVKIDNAVTAMN